jgi:carbon storage regulator CsrA
MLLIFDPITEGVDMLVLSRKMGEAVVIGDRIKVNIKKISGGKVQIGVEAPRDVRILRGELDDWSAMSSETDHGDVASN